MKLSSSVLTFVTCLVLAHIGYAKSFYAKKLGCMEPTAARDLDINNVRTTILNGGDMWWNLNNARYEVPKVAEGQVSKNALFAGAIWIGGVRDENLYLAAQTYRQNGSDFYPGPLQTKLPYPYISESRCKTFDKIWAVKLIEINAFKNNPKAWANPNDDFSTWPAMGDIANGEAQFLAPFIDRNSNGIYEVNKGDYPAFKHNESASIPDMMLFWICNDRGNIHTESQALPIGLELHYTAFANKTNDEINNTTFYRTIIFNRGNETLDSCIFAQWTDPDLGNQNDDYVQFDVNRSLMITYNGDDEDEGVTGYGVNPPSVGIRMFQGPTENKTNVPIGTFISYEQGYTPQGDPSRPEHYWSYLNGRWKDDEHLTYGNNGKQGVDTCSIMFPGLTDINGRREWTEGTEGNIPRNRKTLIAYAPFSLLPGAVNKIDYAVVWAGENAGGATGSIDALKQASDKAYNLYQTMFTDVKEENKEDKAIGVYPNPSADFLYVKDHFHSTKSIVLFNITGKEILVSMINDQQKIDIEHLKVGIYFYQLRDKKGKVMQSGKWLKY